MKNTNDTSPNLGRLGNLVVKIAQSPEEIAAAQKLRHDVFISEKNELSPTNDIQKDEDYFDQFCDHLIVVEEGGEISTVVATYRLMGGDQAKSAGRFYSQTEFDVNSLIKSHSELQFLELGRSCVKPEYRTKRTIELLWHGSWAYVRQNNYDVMFGCASFTGTDMSAHIEAMAFLAKNAAPEAGWKVKGIGDVIQMDGFPFDIEDTAQMKRALRALPPLIKGYLRLGAMFATDAVVDHDFGTTDVLVLLPISRLNPRYVNYYGENAERHSS